jgi:peptide chain release factor 1
MQKDSAVGKGCKSGVLKVNGEGVYRKMKCESGIHKVIRVPETDAKGRL